MSADILALPPSPADIRLSYGSHRLNFGDLRLPAGPGPHPVAVVIHGGFWRARYDLTHAGHLCAALTAAGIATWNVEYRRVGNGGGWPATFTDVAAAADHLPTLARDHPLDLDRVIALGHSAGGHLALWLAARGRLSPGNPLFDGDPIPWCGAVALAGVSDLRLAYNRRLGGGIVETFLGGMPEEVPERYDLASPAALLPFDVPQILIHGTEDQSVPYEMSRLYAEAAGSACTLVTLPGAGHFEPIDPRSQEWPRVLEAVRVGLS